MKEDRMGGEEGEKVATGKMEGGRGGGCNG